MLILMSERRATNKQHYSSLLLIKFVTVACHIKLEKLITINKHVSTVKSDEVWTLVHFCYMIGCRMNPLK